MRRHDIFHMDAADKPLLHNALAAAQKGPMDETAACERVSAAARDFAREAKLDAAEATGSFGKGIAGRFVTTLFGLRAISVQQAAQAGLYAGAMEHAAEDAPPKIVREVRFGG